jgi:hypothetical protein
MKTSIGHAILIGLAVAAASSSGCSSASPPNTSAGERVGSVGMSLQVAPGITINTVTWTVTNTATQFSETGTVSTQFSNSVSFQVGGLPTGSGYSIALTGTSTDGTTTCTGSATFNVTPGATTAVHVTLLCSGPTADAGNIAVTATTQICANISALSASPTEAAVGTPVALSAIASAGAAPVSYLWTATAGTFSDPTNAAPTFTCPNTPAMVTIAVSVSPSAGGCTTTTSESVTVTCDVLAPTFTNVYADVIGARCTGCHQPGKSGVTTGMLDMSTQAKAYADLVGVPAMGVGAGSSGVTCASLGVAATSDASPPLLRVAPGDAADSLIFDKVSSKVLGTNPPCGSPMPSAGAALTQPQVDLIQAWIAAGAPNN